MGLMFLTLSDQFKLYCVSHVVLFLLLLNLQSKQWTLRQIHSLHLRGIATTINKTFHIFQFLFLIIYDYLIVISFFCLLRYI